MTLANCSMKLRINIAKFQVGDTGTDLVYPWGDLVVISIVQKDKNENYRTLQKPLRVLNHVGCKSALICFRIEDLIFQFLYWEVE